MRSAPVLGLLGAGAAGLLWLSWTIRQHGYALPGVMPYAVADVWILGMFVLLVWARSRDGAAPSRTPLAPRLADPVNSAAACLLALGLVFRSTGLDRLAWGYQGLNFDAAYNSEVAFRILDGRQGFAPVFATTAYVRDALTHYYLAAFYAVGGRNVETLRFACNVLALVNCALLFVVLRNYTRSTLVVLGTTALYVFSGADTVFAMSGMEYVMTTPFLLGSFILFERARRLGTRFAAAVAGLVWGLGISSHYPYLFLAPILPAIALVHLRSTRRWLGVFLLAGLAAALPKLTYLVFNARDYLTRFIEVSRHDESGRVFIWEYFVLSARNLRSLLFEHTSGFKVLLPESPLIPPLQIPLLAIGILTAIIGIRRPEHLFALGVVAFSFLVNLGAFVEDYRLINAMPVVFLLTGIGLRQCERALGDGWPARMAVGTLVGILVIGSVSTYFSDTDGAGLRNNYSTNEVALARRLRTIAPPADTYVLAPRFTYKSVFFNNENPDLLAPSYRLQGAAYDSFSMQGAAIALTNVQNLVRRYADRGRPVHFVLGEASPYTAMVRRYLASRDARFDVVRVTDPVSHTTSLYQVASLTVSADAVRPQPADQTLLRRVAQPPPDDALRTLSLTTFADPDQMLPVDEREVPARLDFDFEHSSPYAAAWTPPFALRWSGYLRVKHTGDHRFDATCDDGCRLFLDDQPVFADWNIGAARTVSSEMALEAGWHSLRIDYFQQANEARFALRIAALPDPLEDVDPNDLANDLGPRPTSSDPRTVLGETRRLLEEGRCERARTFLERMASSPDHTGSVAP